jgi:hypothetical protein
MAEGRTFSGRPQSLYTPVSSLFTRLWELQRLEAVDCATFSLLESPNSWRAPSMKRNRMLWSVSLTSNRASPLLWFLPLRANLLPKWNKISSNQGCYQNVIPIMGPLNRNEYSWMCWASGLSPHCMRRASLLSGNGITKIIAPRKFTCWKPLSLIIPMPRRNKNGTAQCPKERSSWMRISAVAKLRPLTATTPSCLMMETPGSKTPQRLPRR